MDIKTKLYVTHTKVFDNDFIAICKSKVTLTISKPANVGMCFWIWAKYWCMTSIMITLKNKHGNNSRLVFTDTDSLMYEMKTEDVYKNFSKDKKCV